MHFGGGASHNDVMVGDSFKSSCAVGQSAVLDGGVGGAAGGVAMTSFYDTTPPVSTSCDVTQSNGITSSFGFTQEQVACVCEVRVELKVISEFVMTESFYFQSESVICDAPLIRHLVAAQELIHTNEIAFQSNADRPQTGYAAAGPRVWNALPPELRHDISFGLFRCKLKSHLFV